MSTYPFASALVNPCLWFPYLQFACAIKVTGNPQTNTGGAWVVTVGMGTCRMVSSPCVPRWHSACLSQLSYCKQVIYCPVFCIWYYLLMISLFKMAPMCGADMLSSDLKCKRTEMCLVEKTHVKWALSRHELQCCGLWVQCSWVNNTV